PYFARVGTISQVNLKLAAEIAGITPEELYELNPAFHRWATDPGGPHYLLMPIDAADVFTENIEQLSADQRLGVSHYTVRRGDSRWTTARHNGMNVNTVARLNGMHPDDALRTGQRIKLTVASGGSGRSASRRRLYYTVREGDTVSQIARLFQCSVPQIMAWNGLSSHSGLHAGQKLRIHLHSHHKT